MAVYKENGKINTTKFFLMGSDRMRHVIQVMKKTYTYLFPTIHDEIVDILNKL